jgi:parallel beta-helix repeat protein
MHKPETMRPCIALLLLALVASCQAKTLVVDPGESGDAKALYTAVYQANSGDTILIQPGNYNGAVVDRRLNITARGQVTIEGSLAITAPGCRISGLTIKPRGKDTAVSLAASDSQLEGCTIAGIATGIKVTGANNAITDCRIDSPQGVEIFGENNEVLRSAISASTAIRLNRTWKSRISDCQISALQGILIEDSRENTAVNNTLSGTGFGVVLTRSQSNNISYNRFSSGYVSALDVVDSADSNLTNNYITGAKVGISLRGSQSCNVTGNICERNERAGIFAEGSHQNHLYANNLSMNGNGILLQGSVENVLLSNGAYGNVYGISLRGSKKNILRGNLLGENSYNLRIDSGQGQSGSSNYDFYLQDIDSSNLLDNKPACYLMGKADYQVPEDCGFLMLVSCKNVTAANLNLSNCSAGVMLVNSAKCNIKNSSIARSEIGCYIVDSLACTVTQILASDCQTGFKTESSSWCHFAYSQARNCSAEGFRAQDSPELSHLGCKMQSCQIGMALHGSRQCRIQNCSAEENQEYGFQIIKSHNCTLQGNTIRSNDQGIYLTGSNYCSLQENNISMNREDGVTLQQLVYATIRNNTVLRNSQGFFVQSSSNISLAGNNLGENSRFGLRMSSCKDFSISENNIYDNQLAGANLVDCKGSLLYHNVFANNGIQNAADNGNNQWDAGPEDGGNYWSDHTVFGNPSQEPRQVAGGNVDRYPFQDPWGWH